MTYKIILVISTLALIFLAFVIIMVQKFSYFTCIASTQVQLLNKHVHKQFQSVIKTHLVITETFTLQLHMFK